LKKQVLTIGKLANAAAVNVETIRYYQRRGLLPEPLKTLGSIRHYSESEVLRIHFIKSAQRLGFTLEEISLLLKLDDGTQCTEAREIAEQKLSSVRAKLVDLNKIEATLAALVEKCNTSQGNVCCPLIGTLQNLPVLAEVPVKP
jgi:MerR family mercuric resistance operon transcriptional regulator